MNYLGKRAIVSTKVIDGEERCGILNMGTNQPDAKLAEVAGQEGEIVGYSGGREYGEGMYDEVLFIIRFDLDGRKFTRRIPAVFVEIVEKDTN